MYTWFSRVRHGVLDRCIHKLKQKEGIVGFAPLAYSIVWLLARRNDAVGDVDGFALCARSLRECISPWSVDSRIIFPSLVHE